MTSKKRLGIASVLVVGAGIAAAVVRRPDPNWIPNLAEEIGPSFDQSYDYGPKYDRIEKRQQYVRMPDGVQIAVEILLPAGGPEELGGFPTLFRYSPYNLSYAIPEMKLFDRVAFWWRRHRWDTVRDARDSASSRLLIRHGYALVYANMRGTGASGGSRAPADPRFGADGAAVVDWIADQPWSNGRVGMDGQSYLGWSQFAVAAQKPRALRCIVPRAIFFDVYTGAVRPGGILMTGTPIGDYVEAMNLNRFDPERGIHPATPVADEDGDGQFADEIPLAGEGDPTTFLDDCGIRYADGAHRTEHIYYRHTEEHVKNLLESVFFEPGSKFFDATFRHDDQTYSWVDINPGTMLEAIADAGTSVYDIAKWFDAYGRGLVRAHATLAGRTFTHLQITPQFHSTSRSTRPYRSWLNYGHRWSSESLAQVVRFLDWCLKDVDNGFDREPPVRYFLVHGGWRNAETWPPRGTGTRSLYFNSGSRLTQATPSGDGIDSRKVDFTHSADYGTNQGNRWTMFRPPDAVMKRTEHDRKTLFYQTAPLDEDTNVVGHPLVHLWISSSQPWADVYAYLSDVAPDGEVYYVSEGQLRAGFHALQDPAMQTGYTLSPKPDLPWHGFREQDYEDRVLADGAVVDLKFDLLAVGWRFRKGHRIRISIAGADANTFELHPKLCPEGTVESCVDAEMRIHRGAGYASRLELPVLE